MIIMTVASQLEIISFCLHSFSNIILEDYIPKYVVLFPLIILEYNWYRHHLFLRVFNSVCQKDFVQFLSLQVFWTLLPNRIATSVGYCVLCFPVMH